MKKIILLVGLTTLLVIGLSHNRVKALAVIPDDGGSQTLSSTSPSNSSLEWNPPAQTCSNGDTHGWPCSNAFNGNNRPYYDVGNDVDYNYAINKLKIYMKENTSVSLTVWDAGPACHNWPGANGSAPGPDYAINSSGGPMTIFQIYKNSSGSFLQTQSSASTDGCTTTKTFAINSSSGDIDNSDEAQKTGYTRYLYLIVTLPPQSILGENSFWLQSSSTDAPIGYAGGQKIGYGFRALNLQNGNYWTDEVVFGLEQTCSTLNQQQQGEVDYADIDAAEKSSDGTAWNPNIGMYLQRRANSGGSWTNVSFHSYSYLAANQNGTLYSGSFDPNFVYRVLLENVGVKNSVFLQFSNNLSQLAGKYQLTTADCFGFKCTANSQTTFIDKNMSAGQSVGVTWTFTNTGQTAWTPTDNPLTQYRRQVNGQWYSPITVPSTVDPGGSFSINTTETAPTSTGPNPKVIKYTMWISTVGAMQGTPCYTQLYLGSPPAGPHGTITSACTTTTVQIWSAATDWYYVYTYHGPGSGGYFTEQAPDLGSDTWSFIPVPDPAPPPAATPGSDYTGPDPLFPSITSTWYWYGTLRTQQTETPATVIPYQVQFFDVNGNPVGNRYSSTIQNAANQGGGLSYGSDTQDTFITMGPALWPHNAYSATLYGEVQSSDFFYKTGPYNDYIPLSSTPVNNGNPCLHAQVSSVCQGGSTINLEVGQSGSVQYTIQLINDTDKTFGSGYTMTITTSGGLQLNDSATKTVTVPGGPGTVNVTGSWNVISNFNGSYSINFGFNGQSLANQIDPYTWDATCPQGSSVATQAHTLPYFQVWWGDVRAGGGFASPSGSSSTKIIGSCGGNGDPQYISPAAGSAGGSEAGGIRAFANASAKLGSQVDFGAYAMGTIDGSAGGPIGFFSGDGASGNNPVFANTTGNMGGFLNAPAPIFCQKDFYTDTQDNPATTSGSLQTDINNCSGRCQYVSNGDITIGAASLPAGKQVTLYVNGDVTIAGNINYPASFSTASQTDIPYLTIIARGNITLTAGVNHLDGLYIAQPTSASDGVFATCDDVCTSQLVINGAVIAQHMELLRSYGTLDQPPTDVNGVGNKPAEIINYVPSMVIGAPALSSLYGETEGLFSLAPVF